MLSFVFSHEKQPRPVIKTVMETAHLLRTVHCRFVPWTWSVLPTQQRPTLPRPAPHPLDGRGKEPARSIQISPVCSHPSPPASASQSRSYFVLLFCAASPGTQMQSADFVRSYTPLISYNIQPYCDTLRINLN